MHEVELTSELYILILKGITEKKQKDIDNIYKTYDDIFPEKNFLEERFEKIMDIIDDKFENWISESIFQQQTLFYILFAIIYHLCFGIKSKIGKSTPKKIHDETLKRIENVAIIIKKNGIESVVEGGTRRLTTQKGREKLFNYFMQKI